MADDSEQIGQDEIEKLLQQAQGNESAPEIPAAAATPTPQQPAPTAPAADNVKVSQNDIELLMSKAEEAIASIDERSDPHATALPPGMQAFELQSFSGTAANSETATLELMRDVQLDMTIELGRTHMQIEDVLKLKQGAVVPLDKLAGDPADIYINGRLVARGEVLVLNDNFCVRVAELIVGDSAVA
ncbi:MAG: flagellar motor switch protein FliN [Pirellulales bacterium]|nr:flagellar motor switch protein FliN [Pirellulales bacterium]